MRHKRNGISLLIDRIPLFKLAHVAFHTILHLALAMGILTNVPWLLLHSN